MIWLRRIRQNRDGVTLVEFAMIAPVLMMALMGIFDLAHTMYTNSLLMGAVQKSARDSTMEDAALHMTAMDANVTTTVRRIAPGATVTFSRTAYTNFGDVARSEDFTDTAPIDGICNHGETYEDANNNGLFDLDRGASGMGGARDAVLYRVTVSYPRLFPVAGLLGMPNTSTMVATTVLRNQPYGFQSAPATRTCP